MKRYILSWAVGAVLATACARPTPPSIAPMPPSDTSAEIRPGETNDIYTGNEDYSGNSLTNPAVPHPYRVPVRSFVHLR